MAKNRLLGRALVELRLTQIGLAEVLAVTPARLNDWRSGRRELPPYIGAHVRTLVALNRARVALADLQARAQGI